MPGYAFGIPAAKCKVGSILRRVKGSVCSKCYAHKGMYSFPVVRDAQALRLKILLSDLEKWQKNMPELLSRKYAKKVPSDKYFRWHDSGDVQSLEHLSAIVEITKNVPDVKFWLPSKEYAIVREYFSKNEKPSNLVVRMSAPMIGAESVSNIPQTLSSTVDSGKGFKCKAPSQNGECKNCRACWDPEIPSIDYHSH